MLAISYPTRDRILLENNPSDPLTSDLMLQFMTGFAELYLRTTQLAYVHYPSCKK